MEVYGDKVDTLNPAVLQLALGCAFYIYVPVSFLSSHFFFFFFKLSQFALSVPSVSYTRLT